MSITPNGKPLVVSSPLSPTNVPVEQSQFFNHYIAPHISDVTNKEELNYIIHKIKAHIHDTFDAPKDTTSAFMKFCEGYYNDKIKTVADVSNRDLFLNAIRTPSRDTAAYLEWVIAFLIVHDKRHGAKIDQTGLLTFPHDEPKWDDVCGKVFKLSNDKGVDLVVVAPKNGIYGIHITYIQVKHGTSSHGYTDTFRTNKFALSTIRYRLRMGRYKIEKTLKEWFPGKFASSYSYDYYLYTSAPIIQSIIKDAKKIRKPASGATEIVIVNRSELADDFERCGIFSALEEDRGIWI
jgi:hypothetical protein